MAIAVSFINMKGGVGKTTLATQVAHAANKANIRTLAIDLDPQANLSQSLMTPKKYVKHLREKNPTIVQLFDRYLPPSDEHGSPKKFDIHDVIVQKTGHRYKSTLDLVPSRLELSNSLKNPTGKERRLAKALTGVADEYDLIIIDCAPTESILTEAAYFASRYVLVPVKPEFMATIGLPLLARSIEEFRFENDDHQIDICGIVFNHSSTYSIGPEGRQAIKEVKQIAQERGWHVYNTHVSYSASYPKSAREGAPIGSTSYARYEVSAEFKRFETEFFDSIGLSKG
jgi:chromosome partitioning protein